MLNSGTPVYSIASDFLGTLSGKTSDVQSYLGRFELEIPAGSQIDAVRIVFTSNGTGTADVLPKFYAVGLIANGAWAAGGVNIATYATRLAVPWPHRYTGTLLIDNQAAWHGGADPSTVTIAAQFTALDLEFSLGEGLSPSYSTPGLVANFQSFLDAEPVGFRANSVSGTALPVLFGVATNVAQLGHQGVYAFESTTPARRPVLEVEWSTPVLAGSVDASGSVAALVGSRPQTFAAIDTSPRTLAGISARGTIEPRVSSNRSGSPRVSARGLVV